MKSDSRTPAPADQADAPETAAEPAPPACVLSFNANDPSGAGGLAGDVATVAAMGGHPLTIVTAILMRDTAEIFDQVALDEEAVIEQARTILEDVTVSGWKVGFLGSADTVAAVAEVLSDYPDVPLVSYVPDLSWLDEDQLQPYQDAYRELILPATEVLVGNLKTLTDLLLPDWDAERPASARELAVAAGDRGTRYVLVTGIMLPARGAEQYIDNVLASPQGAITGEKFERFDTGFVGSGDTLSAALASLLAAGSELQAAVGEALAFLDQSLDAGFRPGMGSVVPDRFFWALPPAGEEGGPEDGGPPPESGPGDESDEREPAKETPRRVH
ncbi:MAG: bifunctional hydroxymethylpyrimidine kinase/phosphomethylpyrimidine kinase [Rubrivivax sp.]